MKKLIFASILLIAATLFTACGGGAGNPGTDDGNEGGGNNSSSSSSSGKKRTVKSTSTNPWKDFNFNLFADTDVTTTYQDYELQPYKELVGQLSPCAMVMVAHVVNLNIDTVPASLSHKTIQMLRGMGFNGVVVSDDLDMGAVVNQYTREQAIEMAINAGNDLLVYGNNLDFNPNKGEEVHATIMKLVKEGKIKKSQIRRAYWRIMKAKKCMQKAQKRMVQSH